MWQALASIVAVLAAPAVRAGLSATRRNRFANRARALHRLADDIDAHDAAGASALRALAARRVLQMIEIEQQTLVRRFDPAWPFAFLVFLLPSLLASFFAWTYSGWWTWPTLVISGLWAIIVVVASSSQVWKEYEAAGVILQHENKGDLIAEQLTPTDEGIVVEQLRRVESPKAAGD